MSARAVTVEALARIAAHDPELNAFTAVFADRALARAAAIDAAIAAGSDPGSLAGVPFAAKNLFDVAGVVTRAGAKVTRTDAPATHDAAAVAALETRGAVLVGATNMDEFAYGFVSENAHDGPTHNPHDRTRIAGGSSGGSAAAVAAELVPLALASDTNGSIRVPAALCSSAVTPSATGTTTEVLSGRSMAATYFLGVVGWEIGCFAHSRRCLGWWLVSWWGSSPPSRLARSGSV